jgi:hypothetical protein
MNLWNKILLGLIAVVALAFFYFGARALRIHQSWRTRIDKAQSAIAAITKEEQDTLNGTQDKPGIYQLQRVEDRLIAYRGPVWFECQPLRDKIDTAVGTVSLMSKETGPHPNPTGSQVFIFRDPIYGPDGKMIAPALYLGEFGVQKIEKNVWDLQPSKGMTETWLREQRLNRLAETLTRLQANQPTTWTIYQILPKDEPFQIAAAPPAEAPTPSAKPPAGEAQPPAWSPPAGLSPQELADYSKKFVDDIARRYPGIDKLTDYEIVFNELYRELTARADSINQAVQELKTIARDQAEQNSLMELLGQQKAIAAAELTKQQGERDEVQYLYKRLDEKYRRLRTDIDETLKANRALAAEIARLQLEGLRRIQQRTEKVAQVSSGR